MEKNSRVELRTDLESKALAGGLYMIKCVKCHDFVSYYDVIKTGFCPNCGKDLTSAGRKKERQELFNASKSLGKLSFVCSKCGNTTSTPKEVGFGIGWSIWFVIGILSVFFAFFQIVALVGMVIAAIGFVVSFSGRKKYVCPNCGQTDCLIPSDSPQGRRLIGECEEGQYGRKGLHEKVEDDDIEKRFSKLAKLLECGAITDAEYEEQRRRILESL